jgi:hypothetical protein
VFVRDPLALSTPLDRNAKARLLYVAEALERRTKAAGRRNGALGYIGLAVLRVLLLRFHNSRSGLCCPSILTLQAATGLCRGAVCDALARLERSTLVRITRRVVRERVTRVSPITGLIEQYAGVIQTTNLYAFAANPNAPPDLPGSNARPFSQPRRATIIERLMGSEAGSTAKIETSLFIYSTK